ncbi:DNA-binding transcriptional regulator, MarR family [Moheibacter sediminis]|uniref:DNA-binding transcriptional regulator, MarR family n=1 Tax=Moheibacter sediminis TaxID=1434700 RepID=A0A1W2A9Y2_9FLAO|nr:DNA-binding transcriptional regulator, MarR family [Moheibacter sediminis]
MLKIQIVEKLESIIFYTMDKSIRTYRNYAQKRLKEQGFKITIDQWLILKAIMENPGIKQQELAEKVFKDSASVTRIIELLVKAKYLDRKPNPQDRRKFDLKITKSGMKILQDVQALVLENTKTALNGINENELQTLHSLLKKITENCQQI